MKLPPVSRLKQDGSRVFIKPLALSDYKTWKRTQDTTAAPKTCFDRPAPFPKKERNLKTFNRIVAANLNTIKKGTDCFWGIFHKEDGSLLGRVGLLNITRDAYQSAEITYRIFNPFWGNGYAAEAVTLCLGIAFSKLKLNRVEALIEPDNKPSIKTAVTSGMKREGTARNKLFTRGRWRDMEIYAALAPDYGFPLRKPE